MATGPHSQGPGSSTKREKLTLATLPSETLKIIFSHAKAKDLANLARVSRAFRDLAAAQLYRRLSHVFADDEKRYGQLSVDYLAGILETLTTADYDYARFIKEISIDADSDSSAEQASHEFRYEYSCGKFLNTLILATLKKIAALESFRWNIRVEVGQSVFLVLSKIPTLQNLHIRLQPGPSLHSLSITNVVHSPPPPPATGLPHSQQTPHFLSQTHNNNVVFVNTNPPYSTNPPYMPPPKPMTVGRSVKPARRLGTSKPIVAPRNFSRFSGLRTLAVLDIDSHEYTPEIAACVSASSASLKSLKLSFSESLALKARRKMTTEISDIESVVDDVESDIFEFQGIAPPPPLPPMANHGNMYGPTTASSSANNQAEIRKERTAQEKALARIFGLDKEDPRQNLRDVSFERAIANAYREANTASKASFDRDKDRLFVTKLKDIAVKMRSDVSSTKGYSAKSLRALEKMEKAANKYLEREETGAASSSFGEKKLSKVGASAPGGSSQSLSSGNADNAPKDPSDGPYFEYLEKVLDNSPHPPTFPFSWGESKQDSLTPESRSQDQNNHDDISPSSEPAVHSTKPEVAHIEDVLVPPGLHDGVAESDLSGPFKPGGIFGPPKNAFEDNISDIVDVEHPDDDGESGDDQESVEDAGEWNDHECQASASEAYNAADIDVRQTEEPSASTSRGKEPVRNGITNIEDQRAGEPSMEGIQQYLRAHHGLSLKTLSIYLIPVKALVLLKAIDIANLRQLTLLNVGVQSPFWAALAKATYPLSLTSIRTDNVTHSFLHFLDTHSGLKELFLFERSRRSKLTPLAPRTTVGIEQLRKRVLKSHVGNLRRLVIRNDDNGSWAFDPKSILTLVKLGDNLEELMIGLDSINLHLFMQQISGLRSLLALQILLHNSKGSGTNILVREIRHGIADTIIHCPTIPVEFVGVSQTIHVPDSDYVTWLRRTVRKPRVAPQTRMDIKGKGRANGYQEPDHDIGPMQELFDEWASEASEDSDEELANWKTKLPTDVKMSDVVGVKMWEREMWGMRV